MRLLRKRWAKSRKATELPNLILSLIHIFSAITGSGTGDLMDLIVGKFKKESSEILDDELPRFAVVGRPNAGKSSIVNAFIGEEDVYKRQTS